MQRPAAGEFAADETRLSLARTPTLAYPEPMATSSTTASPQLSHERVSPLLTDLYELTMLQAYFDRQMLAPATFELFARRLPPTRNFLIAAGLEQAVDYLRELRFTGEDLARLRATGLFREPFLDWLGTLKFTGDLHAVPEGTVVFGDEPILRVTASLPEAQLVESRLINLIHFQTSIASKAARCILAAPGKTLVDFGMRRAHGSEAALYAARASYLVGFAGTSNVLANTRFGIPIFGTMAHSFIEAHDSESVAFEHFIDSHVGPNVLLIDTYDTEAAAQRVVELARRRTDKTIASVRLDSGDLDALARRVRAIFDAAGLRDIGIFASGGLDELGIAKLVAAGAPIDGFGVGTSLDVAADCPALDCAYKLEEYAGRPRRKRSTGKATWPGAKQVYRQRNGRGELERDLIALISERHEGAPLLQPVLRGGELVAPLPGLPDIRRRVEIELGALPPPLRALDRHAEYRVDVSAELERLAARVDAEFR
jgi:nicotinate phosphoribosyltransferase